MNDSSLKLRIAKSSVRPPVAAGDIGKPCAIFGVGQVADPLQVTEYRETERVRVEYRRSAFESNAGCAMTLVWLFRTSSMKAVVDQSLLVEAVDDRVVPERRPAFVHHLGLRLRVKILRELADDAHQLALPRLELRRVLLDEIQDVLLRLRRERAARKVCRTAGSLRQRAPQVVELPFAVRLARGKPRGFGLERRRRGPPVAVDAVRPSARGRRRAPPRPPRRHAAPRTPSRSAARTPGSPGCRRPRSTAGTDDCP